MSDDLRELGLDLLADRQFERALAIFAEAVRRSPADYRARMLAARCFNEIGESERAVTVLHACAEGLLRRDYLLSAIAACKLALAISPNERRLKDTLIRIHARAVRTAPGKASVPPPLPPEALYEGKVKEDLMGLQGSELSDKAIEVLAASDPGGSADPSARPPLPLFADLDRDAFLDLVPRMGYRPLAFDEPIAREGEGGDAIVMIVAGKLEITRQVQGEPKTLGFLGGGSIFGEISIMTGAPPTVTIKAIAETEIFEIRREHLNAITKDHPQVAQALAEFAQKRMAKNLMSSSPFLLQVGEAQRAAILQRFAFRAVTPNEKVLVEGEHSPGLFLVLAGELMVQKDDPGGGVVTLGVLREGDVAGEISLLTGLRATATVVSTRKTATAFLPREAFEELSREYPATRTYLQELSDRRLKQIGEAMRPAEIIDADELVESDSPPPRPTPARVGGGTGSPPPLAGEG